MPRRRALPAAALVAAALALTACGGGSGTASTHDNPYGLVEPGVLSLATTGSSQPFSYTDKSGKVVGFDLAVYQELAKRLGLKTKVKTYEFDSILPMVSTHQVDIAMNSIADTDERRKSVSFTLPNYTGTMDVLVRNGSSIGSGAAGIKGKRVAVQAASMSALYAEKYFTDSTLVTFPDTGAAVTALRSKNVDAAFLDGQEANKFTTQYAVHTTYATADPKNRGAAVVVNKKQTALRKALNKQLRAIVADGTYQRLFTKWAPQEKPAPQLAFLKKYYAEHPSNSYPN
ncbi:MULTISPECIES: substrate-binding periplasmic protein [Streptomyces]|uniref:ABC-type amino acid transport substrate-binding protein n=2 Tax=Streptomyces TaxID=1883 RepID=A0ABT9L118_9ACTN|nr:MULTISPECIES: ABC transporter substrate-binding protein [Streptomyces]MBW8087851.1 amino acid ABC transporter substrate-binding protein [Streptomyces hygroscopicus subsp. hygroscopicus]MCO8306512.1 ABC transporter substrate-binding protein [Streptomyces sp. RKCA744]MDN3058047.1 ABC transporter substrate-binding protein [Streptomyces sp. SRF1]MDP9614395.1 ABC-type amino acid transport substrate-binding protein [Streptomyces demainii]GHJ32278.1 amino acid ABC transporter substrate-binding pro